MRFASFLSGGFITAIVVNPPEMKLAKRTSVHSPASLANHNTAHHRRNQMVAILDPTKVSSAMSSSEITNFKFNPIVN